MSAALRVISPGIHTTIQDFGRFGFRKAGVPSSGPLDRIALTFANALVGNPMNTPALEMLLSGSVLEVQARSARVALVGGATGMQAAGRSIPAGQSVRLSKGDRIQIGPLVGSFCAYLAVEGGFEAAPCLGSVATYARNNLGGAHGRALRAEDGLALRLDGAPQRPEQVMPHAFPHRRGDSLRVVLGPQDDHFTTPSIETFLSATYSISAKSDRMAFRLDGPALAHINGFNIVSDGVLPGSIQVLGTGQPIVLMADAQTMGGYPKIATVISADLPLLGRATMGSTFRFSAVTQEQAETIRRDQEREIAEVIEQFQPVRGGADLDTATLTAHNLIDGVVDALV